MRRMLLTLSVITFILFPNTDSISQEKKEVKSQQTKLSSDKLIAEGKDLDNQIININNKIQNVISTYKLLTTKSIRLVPYRVTYRLGENYIEIEKYELKRDILSDDRIIGIKNRRIRVYTTGENISKIESEVSEKDVGIESETIVKVVDPSPTTAGTDDIIFTHSYRNKKLINNKKLGEIKNNRIFPIRNDIKKDFLIPHFSFLYNTVLDIAETYYKGIKDSDSLMTEFLIKSTKY